MPRRGNLRGEALIAHHRVHELKAAQRFSVGDDVFQPYLQSFMSAVGFHER